MAKQATRAWLSLAPTSNFGHSLADTCAGEQVAPQNGTLGAKPWVRDW